MSEQESGLIDKIELSAAEMSRRIEKYWGGVPIPMVVKYSSWRVRFSYVIINQDSLVTLY